MKIEYSGNNSGGYFWLTDDDWEKLEAAGWVREDRRETATKDFETLAGAIREFEELTGQDASAEGCNCCGPPHYFRQLGEKGSGFVGGSQVLRVLFPEQPEITLRQAMERLAERDGQAVSAGVDLPWKRG